MDINVQKFACLSPPSLDRNAFMLPPVEPAEIPESPAPSLPSDEETRAEPTTVWLFVPATLGLIFSGQFSGSIAALLVLLPLPASGIVAGGRPHGWIAHLFEESLLVVFVTAGSRSRSRRIGGEAGARPR